MKPGPGWEDDPTVLRGAQRVFSLQLSICVVIGLTLLLLFCMFRSRWPHMYALRTLRDRNVKPLPAGWFGWIWAVYKVSDEELLRVLGLDAYVFVAFFQMAIKIFFAISILAVVVMLPARYWAKRDDGVDWMQAPVYGKLKLKPKPEPQPNDSAWFFYLYAAATYIFSTIVYQFLLDYTKKILKIRQKYLASQNSITDRTILLSGIPAKLLIKNDPQILAEFVESMGIGKVVDVNFVYDWEPLNKLFDRRKWVISQLEELYAKIHGLEINLYNQQTPAVSPMRIDVGPTTKESERVSQLRHELLSCNEAIRMIQSKFNFLTGTMNDKSIRQINCAFITMDSVALAQMAAQTVLDPRVHKLIVHLAPAPKDIKWDSFKLTPDAKLFKSYMITFIIFLSFLALAFPISSISTLINLKTISKFWPEMGKIIRESKWLTMIITGILPPFLFSMFNFLLPYFYKWLTYYQGHLSNSDIELSTLLKNFFYIFFNLFLVFTVTGTVLNFLASLGIRLRLLTN